MSAVKENKKVREVFADYETESNILNAQIKQLNLIKKQNKLEMTLESAELIEIKDLWFIEKFIKNRFRLSEVTIIIKYKDGIQPKSIEEEWENLTCFMARKYPVTKSMLVKSTVEVNDNQIKVTLPVRGADFLKAKKFDKELGGLIKNIYGKEYKIELIENISEEDLKVAKEKRERAEKLAVERTMEHWAVEQIEEQEISENKKEKQPKQEPKNAEPEIADEKPIVQEEETPLIYGRNINIKEKLVKVNELTPDEGRVAIAGEIINTETRELRSGKVLLMFDVYDGSSTITCKIFAKDNEDADRILGRMKKAKGVKLVGNAQLDPYAGELTIMANTVIETAGAKKQERQDLAEEKRVELHMHTQMSQMDAMTSATDLIKRAMKWGWKSIAITDHGVVQAFPEAHKLLGRDNKDMKVIYGVEAYLAPDKMPSVTNSKGQSIDTTYCVLDLETTGFSAKTEKITEIGVMKVKDGKVLDEFACFVNPEKPIPQRVVEVTKITDDMVKNAETIDKVFPKLLEFLGDSVLVAHNADFDIGFLKQNAKDLGYDFDYTYVDTLSMARDLFPDFKKYQLGKIAEKLKIKVEVAHRALDDVDTTVKVMNVMMDMLKERGAKTIEDIDLLRL